ncbi:acyltransferase family protein [Flavobacterium sp. ARAG 55.4]|uniref:acyltransferase family protein n=1 Tax=Flavobacterium sp. ARAG 55.4 TaxID=3451357 RepID=UPI003F45A063
MLKKIVNISPGTFRLILALTVVVFHAVSFISFGHAVVYMFFVLSGYWIFKMYSEKYLKFNDSYWVYLRSRFLRLYPVYWVILFFTLSCYIILPGVWEVVLENSKDSVISNFVSNFFVVGNGIKNKYWFILPAWSLAVELQFYIIAPILVWLQKSKKTLFTFFIISSLVVVILVYFKAKVTGYDSVLLYLPYFLLGGLVYFWDLKVNYKWAKIALLLVVSLIVVSHFFTDFRMILLDKEERYIFLGYSVSEVFNCVLTVVILPFIIYNIRQPVKDFKKDSLLSSMSFVVYLLHWPLLQIYSLAVQTAASGGIKIIYAFLYFTGCIGFSYLLSKYVDMELEDKRRVWMKKFMQKRAII